MSANNPEKQERVDVGMITDEMFGHHSAGKEFDNEYYIPVVLIKQKCENVLRPIIDRLQAEIAEARKIIENQKALMPLPEPQGETVTTAGGLPEPRIKYQDAAREINEFITLIRGRNYSDDELYERLKRLGFKREDGK